jgi:APA family basic amino acid/polyamine antiporter
MKDERQLTLFDFTIIMVSLVIGMGIFRTPVNVAQSVQNPLTFYAAWLVGGLIALCGSLTYAEIGSRMPVTGGYYKVMAYAYHPSIAFAINCIILVTNASALCAVALVGSEYISGFFLPQSHDKSWLAIPEHARYMQTFRIIIAILSILVFYAINLMGLKLSARAQNILTLIKITLILLLVSPIFFVDATPAQSIAAEIQQHPTLLEFLKSFGTALIAISFTYGGYQHTINFGAEVMKPRKNIPRGIFLGLGTIILLYLLINFAYISVIGFDNLKSASNIAALMAAHVFGPYAEKTMSVLLFLSVLAFVNIQLMTNPRIMEAMSQDKILPASFNRRNPKTEVLTMSLTLFTILCVLIIFWAKEFNTLLNFTIFLDCFGMAFSAGSIFIIRKKSANTAEGEIYKMKLYPLLPIIFILAYTGVCISIFVTSPKVSLIGVGVLAAFIILYFLTRKVNLANNVNKNNH